MQALPEIKPDATDEPRRGRRPSNTAAPPPLTRRSSRISVDKLVPDEPDRRSSINFSLPDGGRRGSIRPGGRPTIGGIGRRLSIMRKMSKCTPRTEPEEEKIELPQAPRFISLLSAEAQYAAMKCYEDLLFDRILNSSPEYNNVFERTPSPPQNLHMLCIKDKAHEDEDKDDDGYGSDTDSERSKPVYVPLPLTRSVTDMSKTKLPTLSREKKLLMSYRFQCAFDILDALKLKDGHIVTSPRVQSAYFDPVRNFATWHHNWSKEFKIVKRYPASAKT